jgi:hypothetical protein
MASSPVLRCALDRLHGRMADTSAAWAASARRSPMSPVRTDPLGSAIATTRASTADPRCAAVRSMPARRARCSGTSSTTSQVFRNLFVAASCCGRPLRHSTRTTVGTTGSRMFFGTMSRLRRTCTCSGCRRAWSRLGAAPSQGRGGPSTAASWAACSCRCQQRSRSCPFASSRIAWRRSVTPTGYQPSERRPLPPLSTSGRRCMCGRATTGQGSGRRWRPSEPHTFPSLTETR